MNQNRQENFPGYDYLYKLVIIGNSGVGKTCILKQFTDGNFSQDYFSTIGVDFGMKDIVLQNSNKIARLQIWDTAGQERFKNITTSYYRSAKGVFIVFDMTNRESFDQVVNWLNELKKQFDNGRDIDINFPYVVLIGNKIDLEIHHVVEREEVKLLADKLNLEYFFTSAKDEKSIIKIFDHIANKIIEKFNIDFEKIDTSNNIKIIPIITTTNDDNQNGQDRCLKPTIFSSLASCCQK
jgi:Ras-related protein Rab-1A